MQNFNAYQFILCLIVFAILTVIFTCMVIYVVKVNCKLISLGAEDEKIKIEYEKNQKRTQSVFAKVIDKIVLGFFVVLFIAMFGLGVSITIRENNVVGKVPTLKVVQSGSMAYVNEYNRYIKEGDVNDHIQAFDIVTIHELPAVEDLKVNDIVLYEIDGLLLVHRIVAIEPPNKEHPDEIHFLLHGDANELPDKFPVKYEQMKGIYLGERVPYVGTFINFLQSPAGYLCILLVIFAVFAVPFAEKKIDKIKYARLVYLGVIKTDNEANEAQAEEEIAVFKDEQALIEQAIAVSDAETTIKESSPSAIQDAPNAHEEELVILEETPIYSTHSIFAMFNSAKSFEEKLAIASDELKGYYNDVVNTLCRIEKIRVIRGFKGETYRCGNKGVLKLAIRGKTLNAFLALDPQDFVDTKYIYENVSNKSGYENYAMRVRITSLRQAKWLKELVLILANNNGFKVAKEPITNIADLFANFKKSKTFTYKLRTASDVVKGRYKEITSYINSFEKSRVIKGKKGETYKLGNKCLCKLTIRGKTLNAYIALEPKEYENTKYIYTDVSSSKSYLNYPMRVKVTSDRQVKWIKELISIVAKGDKTL